MPKLNLEKVLKVYHYDEQLHEAIPYDVPIYPIPLNKKGFCKPFVRVIGKGGKEIEVPRCKGHDEKNCVSCVTEAKKLYKMNH